MAPVQVFLSKNDALGTNKAFLAAGIDVVTAIFFFAGYVFPHLFSLVLFLSFLCILFSKINFALVSLLLQQSMMVVMVMKRQALIN